MACTAREQWREEQGKQSIEIVRRRPRRETPEVSSWHGPELKQPEAAEQSCLLGGLMLYLLVLSTSKHSHFKLSCVMSCRRRFIDTGFEEHCDDGSEGH